MWSLQLRTREFDARALTALPDLPGLAIFEHHACTLGEDPLAAFARFTTLRILRLWLADASALRIGATHPPLATLTDSAIHHFPARPWATARSPGLALT